MELEKNDVGNIKPNDEIYLLKKKCVFENNCVFTF
jgi:hypothetical protein